MKAIDFPFYHHGHRILQLDTDILFFQNPHEIRSAMQPDSLEVVYNGDRGPALAYAAQSMINFIGKPVDELFNGGLVAFTASRDFHAFAEKVLSSQLPLHKEWTEEQTLTAMFLAATCSLKRLPPDYDVSFALLALNSFTRSTLVSQHYCAWARMLFCSDFLQFVYPFIKKPPWYIRRYYKRHLTEPLPKARNW